jgi:hypothetical protein
MNEAYRPCIFGILTAPIVYLYKLATDGMATSKDPRMLYLDNYQLFTAQFVLDLIQKADSGACLSNHLKGLPYQLPSGITLKTFILVNYVTLYEYLYPEDKTRRRTTSLQAVPPSDGNDDDDDDDPSLPSDSVKSLEKRLGEKRVILGIIPY